MSKTAVQSLMEKLQVFQDTLSADEQRALASMIDQATGTGGSLSAGQLANVSGGVATGSIAMHEYRGRS